MNLTKYKQYIKYLSITRFILFTTTAVHSQKIMDLPDSFVTNSQQLRVTEQHKVGFPRYKIGNFAVITGQSAWTSFTRTGWTDESFIAKLVFGRNETIKLQEKSSFQFAGPSGDTAFVTTAAYTILSYRDQSGSIIKSTGAPKQYTGGLTHYTAIIQTTSDTLAWILQTSIKETPGEKTFGLSTSKYIFSGTLSCGSKQYSLKEVAQFNDGKKSIIPGMLGLTIADTQVVAAVQFHTGSFKKNNQHLVWINTNLPGNLQLVLTATTAALLARMHDANGNELEMAGQ